MGRFGTFLTTAFLAATAATQAVVIDLPAGYMAGLSLVDDAVLEARARGAVAKRTDGGSDRSMQKILFPPDVVAAKGTRCLDGSPAGFYLWTPPTDATAGATEPVRVVIYLEGGGLCVDESTCTARAKTDLGSSNNWPATLTQSGIISSDCTENPEFCNAAKIFVPYCTGDLWVGTRTEASPSTFGLYFSGHLIFTEVMSLVHDRLVTLAGIGNGVEVILSGGSAGGIGTLTHTNWLGNWGGQLRAAMEGTTVRVTSVPNAGFFINAKPYVAPYGFPCTHIAGAVAVQLYDAWFDSTCAEANPNQPYVCVCGPWMLTAIQAEGTVPLFLAESQFDTNQLYVQDGAPAHNGSAPVRAYVAYFGDLMRRDLAPAMADNATFIPPRPAGEGVPATLPLVGVFAPSCLAHEISWTGISASPGGGNGTSAAQTFMSTLYCWYFGDQGVYKGCESKVMDYCGELPCGAASDKCGHLPPGGI